MLIPTTDHVGLWENELRPWLPPALFDAHVHLGLPDAVGSISPERRRSALSTFMHFSWEELLDTYASLYRGKAVAGLVAFPFPQREVRVDRANDYLIEVMRRAPRVKGFLLSEPTDARAAIAAFERAARAGVRFAGVKPYADRLGKSNFEARMAEFLPADLLEFMDAERLVMLLHTSGLGVGDRDVQDFLRLLARRYPRVRVMLAHLGRYVRVEQFLAFMDSGVLEDCPNLYLEMSSASRTEAYARILRCDWLHDRLVFGSDLPFGLITGVEHWSDTHGAIFLTRDAYPWSDPKLDAAFATERRHLTYNTYHTIKAFKDALASSGLTGARAEALKQKVFCDNGQALFGESRWAQAGAGP